MKKILLLAILLCISSLTYSQTFDFDGFSFSVNTDDPTTVTVTGRATGNTNLVIVIPDTATDGANVTYAVTNIGDNAFENNQLDFVLIANSVTSIGNSAFRNNQLDRISIPNSVTSIGSAAFLANQLTTVTIGNSVGSIGNVAFEFETATNSGTGEHDLIFLGDIPPTIDPNSFIDQTFTANRADITVTAPCITDYTSNPLYMSFFAINFSDEIRISGDLMFKINSDQTTATVFGKTPTNTATDIVIPNTVFFCNTTFSVTSIGAGVFQNAQLTSVSIPNSVITIERGAFRTNQLTSVSIPNSVTTIDRDAFRDNQLTSVSIPESVTTIQTNAFRTNQLTSVSIPNSITMIEAQVFMFNPLTSVTVGTSVNSIGNRAFSFAVATNPGTGEHQLTFLGESPPTIQSRSFHAINNVTAPNRQDITVLVPCTALTNYTNDPLYTGFFAINPPVSFATSGDLCMDAGTQTGLTGGYPEGGVYSGPGVTDNGNGMTYNFDPTAAGVGEHTITYTFANPNFPECSDTANDTIEVFAGQIATFTAPANLPIDAGIQTGLSGGTPAVNIVSTTVTISVDYEDVFVSISPLEGDIIFDSAGAMQSTTVIFTDIVNGGTYPLMGATATGATIDLDFGSGATGNIMADGPIVGASGSLNFISGSSLNLGGDNFTFLSGTGTAITDALGTGLYAGPAVTNEASGTLYSFDPALAGVGTHTITYTYTDENGCAATASDTIVVFIDPCDTTTTYTIAGGWDNGTPDATTRAIITEDYNTTTMGLGDITACELIINTDATVTITDGHFVSVENDITIDGSLLIEHQASLVQVNEDAVTINNGSIAVAKTTPTLDDRNFVAMSSPVTAEARDRVYGNSRAVFSIIPSNFVPFVIDFVEFPEFEFAENFLDDNGDYLLPVTGSTATPAAGIGQLIFPQPEPNVGDGAYTLTYTQNPSNPGTLNSGTISVSINYNGPATTNNYNLLGNPYASAIDVTAFINANDAVNEIYYWDHITNPTSDLPGFGTSNFSMNDVSIRNAMMGIAAVNGGTAPGQFMASGQGFGIKADQAEMMAGTPVVFTNSLRVTGNNDGFRNSETSTDIDKLWLNLTTTAYDEAMAQTGIGFTPNATPAIDKGYDSPRLGTFLSLFTTVASGELLGIQAREAFDTDIEIALGFSTSIEEATTYTISIGEFEGIAIENATVFIIDHVLNTIVNLNEQSYTFTAQKGVYTDRFTIVFQDREALSVDGESFRESEMNLYPNPSQGQVTLAYTGTSTLEKALITDINGKIIKRIDLSSFNQTQTMDLGHLAKGMYFMQITSQNNTITKKLMIRH